jgi:hypothetical protein
VLVTPPDGALPTDAQPTLDALAVIFIVGSLASGLLWMVPRLRRLFGLDMPVDDVRSGQRIAAAVVGFAGSSAIAAFAGVSLLIYIGVSSPASGFSMPLLPLGAALIGGVSVYGRRGGVAGTVLATVALASCNTLLAIHAMPVWVIAYLPATMAITVGIGVSALHRFIETHGSTPAAANQVPYPAAPTTIQNAEPELL